MTSGKAEKPHSGCFGKKKRKRLLSEPYFDNQENYQDDDLAIEYGFDIISTVEQRALHEQGWKIEKLPNALGAGKAICLTASTLLNCQRWAVNLLCGNNPAADIALHFNPRLLQHYVVRNSRIKGLWGNEETLLIGPFDIKYGESFILKIFTTDDQFFVTYNDKHVCSFRFRVPPITITHVEVNGNIELYQITMEKFSNYPVKDEGLYVVKEIDEPVRSQTKLAAPIRAILPEGLQEHWQLEMHGTPKMLPQTFFVELKENVHIWPSSAIALQMSANFGNNMLVRNAFIDNKWGTAERIRGSKFLPATPFSLWIRRGSKRYSIWVNGMLQAEFMYRSDPDHVKSVHVHGDVCITGIYVNKNPDKYFLRT